MRRRRRIERSPWFSRPAPRRHPASPQMRWASHPALEMARAERWPISSSTKSRRSPHPIALPRRTCSRAHWHTRSAISCYHPTPTDPTASCVTAGTRSSFRRTRLEFWDSLRSKPDSCGSEREAGSCAAQARASVARERDASLPLGLSETSARGTYDAGSRSASGKEGPPRAPASGWPRDPCSTTGCSADGPYEMWLWRSGSSASAGAFRRRRTSTRRARQTRATAVHSKRLPALADDEPLGLEIELYRLEPPPGVRASREERVREERECGSKGVLERQSWCPGRQDLKERAPHRFVPGRVHGALGAGVIDVLDDDARRRNACDMALRRTGYGPFLRCHDADLH